MTDRLKGFTVILEDNIREDDAIPIMNALLQIKGVQSVTSHVVVPADYITASQTKSKIVKQVLDFVHRDILKDDTR